MSMYCEGNGCEARGNCLRYILRPKTKHKEGYGEGTWYVDEKECKDTDSFFYVKVRKENKDK